MAIFNSKLLVHQRLFAHDAWHTMPVRPLQGLLIFHGQDEDPDPDSVKSGDSDGKKYAKTTEKKHIKEKLRRDFMANLC